LGGVEGETRVEDLLAEEGVAKFVSDVFDQFVDGGLEDEFSFGNGFFVGGFKFLGFGLELFFTKIRGGEVEEDDVAGDGVDKFGVDQGDTIVVVKHADKRPEIVDADFFRDAVGIVLELWMGAFEFAKIFVAFDTKDEVLSFGVVLEYDIDFLKNFGVVDTAEALVGGYDDDGVFVNAEMEAFDNFLEFLLFGFALFELELAEDLGGFIDKSTTGEYAFAQDCHTGGGYLL